MKYKMLIFSLMATTLMSSNSWAGSGGSSGTCGDGCVWSLSDGELHISADSDHSTATMTNYTSSNYSQVPWYSQNSRILAVTVDNSITSIGTYAFYRNTRLSEVTLPNNSDFTSIGSYAFASAGLHSITIPDSVTSIGNAAFRSNARLSSVTLPNNSDFTSIAAWTFEGCSMLASITIPDSVTSIGGRAFKNARSLASITIPDNVTSIGSNAFEGASALETIYIGDKVNAINADAFKDISANAKIYCQESSNRKNSSGEALSCSDIISANNPNDLSKLQLYTRDENGNMMLYSKNDKGQIISDGKVYTSLEKFKNGVDMKRIYTIDEANRVAGKTNQFRIKYR